ncbi:MAG: hypothetical protein ABEI53_03780, partial [Candidatus Magasanikbacteria bacterium]
MKNFKKLFSPPGSLDKLNKLPFLFLFLLFLSGLVILGSLKIKRLVKNEIEQRLSRVSRGIVVSKEVGTNQISEKNRTDSRQKKIKSGSTGKSQENKKETRNTKNKKGDNKSEIDYGGAFNIPDPVQSKGRILRSSFTDLFSGVGWIDSKKTTMHHDKVMTAFTFKPVFE